MGSIQYVKLHINSPQEELFGLLFFFLFGSLCGQSVLCRALSTQLLECMMACLMKWTPGQGGIMELRDGERGMEGSAGPQEGPGDQVFSINSGVSRAGREAPSLPAWLLECASKTGDRGGEYCSEVQW